MFRGLAFSEEPWADAPAAGFSRDSIGGSDANAILSGSENRILRLWQEKRGEAEAEDLSSSVAVMLGCWTEAFNRQWYERVSGNTVGAVGDVKRCEIHS